MKKSFTLFILISLGIMLSISQTPSLLAGNLTYPTINYQGYIKDKNNQIKDFTVDMVVSIFNVETGGIPLWQEPHDAVEIQDGYFNLQLGLQTDLSTLPFSDDLYLSLNVGGENLLPRRKMSQVLRAYYSDRAATVDDNAVTSSKISAGAITSDKISAQSITSEKLANGAITAEKFDQASLKSTIQSLSQQLTCNNAVQLGGINATEYVLRDEVPYIVDGSFEINGVLSFTEQKADTRPEAEDFIGKLYVRGPVVNYQANSSLTDDLIMYWRMDEKEGDTLYDGVSSQNNGTAYNGVSIVKGKLGMAKSFNGAQYITKDNENDVDFDFNDFSVSFWMKSEKSSEWYVLMNKANDWGERKEYYGWVIANAAKEGSGSDQNTDLEFFINSGGIDKQNHIVARAENVFNDQWRHIVALKKGESISLYVDGDKKDQKDEVKQSVSVEKPFCIGALNDFEDTLRYHYTGLIDDVAIWSRAISESEILTLYNDRKYEGIPYSDERLVFISSSDKEYVLNEPNNRQEVFRHDEGEFSWSSTSWNDFTNANGTAIIRVLHPTAWMFSISGHNYGTSNTMFFRLKCTNKETESVYYLPKEKGFKKYMHNTYSSYEDGLTMQGVTELPKGEYDVQLQVKNSSTHSYKWYGSKGQVVFIMW